MTELLIPLLGFIAGVIGYLVVTFVMSPLLRYLDIRHQVISDLVFYANVINADHLNDKMKQRLEQRQDSNRRHAAELAAAYFSLPSWARLVMQLRKEYPLKASTSLIGLSNTEEYQLAHSYVAKLKASLNIGELEV